MKPTTTTTTTLRQTRAPIRSSHKNSKSNKSESKSNDQERRSHEKKRLEEGREVDDMYSTIVIPEVTPPSNNELVFHEEERNHEEEEEEAQYQESENIDSSSFSSLEKSDQLNTPNWDERLKQSLKTRAPRRDPVGGKWNSDEDGKLIHLVSVHGAKNWKRIAKLLGTVRTDVQCLHRYNKVLKPGLSKGPWTKEEDDAVRSMVLQYGIKSVKWSQVALNLGGRIGKQCRERWYNHLDPSIKKGGWTKEEDEVLFKSQIVFGNRWSEISKLLPGRTENSVKNRFNSAARKNWYDHQKHRFVMSTAIVRNPDPRKISQLHELAKGLFMKNANRHEVSSATQARPKRKYDDLTHSGTTFEESDHKATNISVSSSSSFNSLHPPQYSKPPAINVTQRSPMKRIASGGLTSCTFATADMSVGITDFEFGGVNGPFTPGVTPTGAFDWVERGGNNDDDRDTEKQREIDITQRSTSLPTPISSMVSMLDVGSPFNNCKGTIQLDTFDSNMIVKVDDTLLGGRNEEKKRTVLDET